jgi:hypothetical protein
MAFNAGGAVGGKRSSQAAQICAARANHERRNSFHSVDNTGRRHRQKPFVVMIVPGEHEVSIVLVQDFPEWLQLDVAAV